MSDLRVSFPKPCDADWEEMAPVGCDRVCGSCARTVHDLRHYTADQVEALVRRDPHACVRAEVSRNGAVSLKPGRHRARRMILAAGAMGMLAAGSPLAAKDRPGAISGTIGVPMVATRVIATASSGKRYRAKIRDFGKYRFAHLPAGVYRLTLFDECGSDWSIDDVRVSPGIETTVAETVDPHSCDRDIVVGMLRIERHDG